MTEDNAMHGSNNDNNNNDDMKIPEIQCSDFLLEKAEAFFAFTDKSFNMLKTNQFTAQQYGFSDFREYLGRAAWDTKTAPVNKIAAYMRSHNQSVMKYGEPLIEFNLCTYHQNKTYLMIMLKTPVFDLEKSTCGVLAVGNLLPIETYYRQLITLSLIDKYFSSKNTKQPQICYTVIKKFNDENLTVRESECLYFMIRGKSAKLIADYLHLSRRTVEEYQANLKQKIGVTLQSQVIEYSVMYNLIHYIPESLICNLLGISFNKTLFEMQECITRDIKIIY